MFANLSLILLIAVTGNQHIGTFPLLARNSWNKFSKKKSAGVFGAKSADRIVGGFPLNITQAPWQVSLQQDSGTYQFCGGSIIGNQWILTAAHCLSRPMQIRVGATHKYTEGHLIDVKRRYVHKKHSYGEDDYDFGLLQLAADLEFSDSVKPIRLPDFGEAYIKNGTICLASGWGKTRNASESSDLLRGVQVPTVDQQICNAAYEGKITPRMICAGYKDGGKDCKSTKLFLWHSSCSSTEI